LRPAITGSDVSRQIAENGRVRTLPSVWSHQNVSGWTLPRLSMFAMSMPERLPPHRASFARMSASRSGKRSRDPAQQPDAVGVVVAGHELAPAAVHDGAPRGVEQ
jgi:hypothetical protein